jgi:hypothetical protein
MLSLVSEDTKTCPSCKQDKYFSEFGKDKTKKLGISSYCKPCASLNRSKNYSKNPVVGKEKLKEYYKNNKDKSRSYSLKNLYGLSVEQFNEMKFMQGGSCKICKTHESNLKRKLFVDHCHTTGSIRGLLCQSCNTMIGNAKDNILVLQAAINYLSSKS